MTKTRLCVYVAGAYSADTVLGVCANIDKGRFSVNVVERLG